MLDSCCWRCQCSCVYWLQLLLLVLVLDSCCWCCQCSCVYWLQLLLLVLVLDSCYWCCQCSCVYWLQLLLLVLVLDSCYWCCQHSWVFMAVPMTPSAAVPDVDGRRYRCVVPFNFLLSLAARHLHGVLVLVTSHKFIASVVSGDNWSPVSTTPAITENPWQIKAGVVDTIKQFISGVVDKHSFDNISENRSFEKRFFILAVLLSCKLVDLQ